MNYLAHAYLSNNDEGLLLGNFIADHIRGNNFNHLSEEIKKGVYLHRKIDQFTDEHPSFKQSKRLFYDGFEKYSGVLVDIYFDHLLAKNFLSYSSKNLAEFTSHVYGIYEKNKQVLPENSERFLSYVLSNNIYFAYSKIEGIEKVLFHLSHRINHGVMLNASVPLFKRNEIAFQENFDVFIKDIIDEFMLKKITKPI
ncbi:MAG: ACP phosphodiesterase [Bacteroidota bacterium]|nr:ACP phosphodiesterase [Bacteroidota bacterium]